MKGSKVLRIQHVKDKSGPFISDNPHVRSIVDKVSLPPPHQDKGFNEDAVARLRDVKASPIKFGFKDEDQMKRTFSDTDLATLKQHGYEPTWVDAKDVWHSNRQSMFTTHEGDDEHAKRQQSIKNKTGYREFSPEEIGKMSEGMKKSFTDKIIALNELLEIREELIKAMSSDEKKTKNSLSGYSADGTKKQPPIPDVSDAEKSKMEQNINAAAQKHKKELNRYQSSPQGRPKDKSDKPSVQAQIKTIRRSKSDVSKVNEIRSKLAEIRQGKLNKSLDELKVQLEELKKAMKQGGLGGPGSVKLGAILPSIKSISSAGKPAGNNSTTPSIGISQPSKKNPLKQAQQTINKDIKDIKMKEAQAHLAPQLVKFDTNGQWSLDKEMEGKREKK